MPCASSIEEAVSLAAVRWPGFEFKIKNSHEACGPCPVCHGATSDGFLIFSDGGTWCRPGDHRGWVDEGVLLSPEEQESRRLAAEVRQIKRKQAEFEKRLTALERMASCEDHIAYHKLMDADDREYWRRQGMFDATIDQALLGICYNCPADIEHRQSWTIPVIQKGVLVNIRHRLVGGDSSDKYRPHLSGLGNTLFGSDAVYDADPARIMIVEGAKKCLVTSQYGFATVGMMGMQGFRPEWARKFDRFKRVNVCLDPDARPQALKLARLFSGRGWVVDLPVKPDDLFMLGGSKDLFEKHIEYAYPVKGA